MLKGVKIDLFITYIVLYLVNFIINYINVTNITNIYQNQSRRYS